jgi:hypothetical protein
LKREAAVGREPPFRENVIDEAQKSPLLEAVTRKCLVKTLRAGKDIACALVINIVEISDEAVINCN